MIDYLDELFIVRDILSKEKTVLLLSDTVWCIIADAYSPAAVHKINALKSTQPDREAFILVDSIESIKQFTDQLHPRIETLLLYHERPINVIYKSKADVPTHLSISGKVTIRCTRNALLSDLLKVLGNPLYATPARTDDKGSVDTLDTIDQKLIEQVDYVFKWGNGKKAQQGLATLISFDEEGELIFHRK